MSAISTILTRLRAAIWAIDVRDDIANAIEQCYSDVSNPTLQTEALEAALQEKIDQGEMAALTIGDHTITAAKLANGVIPTADATLTEPGKPADAAETGRQFGLINESLDDVKDDLGDLSGLETETKTNLVSAINEAAQSGLSDEAKDALLSCFESVIWDTPEGKTKYRALSRALNYKRIITKVLVEWNITKGTLVDVGLNLVNGSEPTYDNALAHFTTFSSYASDNLIKDVDKSTERLDVVFTPKTLYNASTNKLDGARFVIGNFYITINSLGILAHNGLDPNNYTVVSTSRANTTYQITVEIDRTNKKATIKINGQTKIENFSLADTWGTYLKVRVMNTTGASSFDLESFLYEETT